MNWHSIHTRIASIVAFQNAVHRVFVASDKSRRFEGGFNAFVFLWMHHYLRNVFWTGRLNITHIILYICVKMQQYRWDCYNSVVVIVRLLKVQKPVHIFRSHVSLSTINTWRSIIGIVIFVLLLLLSPS